MLRKLIVTLTAVILLCTGAVVSLVYLAPERFTQMVMETARLQAGLARKEITLPDGLHYVYLEGGAVDKSGEPLLLLHGFGANKDAFVQIASKLTGRYHLIIPDQIGFGESSKPSDADYGPDAQAGHLHALLQTIGITGPVHVGGNSMGGMISLHYALNFPADTASLWLLNPAGVASAPQTVFLKAALNSPKNPLLISSTDDLAYVMTKAAAKPAYIPRPMLNVMAQDGIKNQVLHKKIFADILKGDTEKRATGMKIPTLIVWGDHDEILHPAGAEILHKELPNSELVMMPGIGHMPMLENPKKTAADFLRFQTALSNKKTGS